MLPSGSAIANFQLPGVLLGSGAGDFMGFPTPSVAHHLINPYDEDLVYLMGGEAVPLDVLDYPTLGKRFLLHYAGGPPDFYELAAPSKPFGLTDPPNAR